MTARSTRHSTVKLWTGAIALLLICGSAGSQGAATLDEAVITESPAGSVEPLRKFDPAVESTTLKSVRDVPETVHDVTTVDKLPADLPTESNGTGTDRDRSVDKSEKLQIQEPLTKVSGVDEEPVAKTSAPEFSEHEDSGKIDDTDGDEDREPTTPPPKREVGKEIGAPKDTKSGPEVGSSLANDTNVNYSGKKPVKKNEGDLGGPKSLLENATNVIATGSDVTDGQSKGKGPKAQVEVVKNTTLPKVQRITEAAAAANEKQEAESLGSTPRESVIETSRSTTTSESKDLESGDSTATSGADVDGEKRGRTISFGGTNEFVTSENKTGGSARDVTDSPVSIGKVATDVTDAPAPDLKTGDFKPYPYARTTQRSNSSSDGGGRVAESTEETSALENTIGQSQQDKKFVVTEPSLVIDNSIQQFKPTYYKRSGNATRIATSPSTVATSSPEDGGAGVTTPSARSITLGNDTTVFVPSLPVFNTENDVPRGKDEAAESSAVSKDSRSSLDLTGNGITEVIAGVKNDSIRAPEDSVTTASMMPQTTAGSFVSRATDDSQLVQNSTEKIATSVDLQTDPEESLLRISSLNVTEETTIVASDQRAGDSTTSTTSSTLESKTTATLSPETSSPLNSTAESLSISTSALPETPLNSTSTPETSTEIPKTPASLTTETSATLNSTASWTTDSSPTNSSITSVPTTTSQTPSEATSAGVPDAKMDNQTVAPEESTAGLIDTEEFSPETTTSKIEYVFVGLTESAASQQYIATSESPNAVTPDTELATPSSAAGFPTVASSTSPRAAINGSESTEETQPPEEMSTHPMTLIADNETSEDFTTTDPSVELTTLENSPSASPEDTIETISTTDDPAATTLPSESMEVITTEEVVASTSFTEAPGIIIQNVTQNTTDTGRAVDASTSRPVVVETTAGNFSVTIDDSTEAATSPSITEEPARIPSANSTSEGPIESPTTGRPSVNATSRDSGWNSGPRTTPTRPTTSAPRPETTATPNDTTGVVTDGSIEILHRGGVPSLVKVVFEGSWADVCPHLEVLQQSLADLLTSGLEKTVLARQIVFQNNPCTSGFSSSTMTTEASITTLLLYVVDENGNFDGEMTKTLPSLYSKSPIKLQVNIRSFQLVQDSDSGNAIAVVVVSCVALICLILLAGLLFIMRKRQTRFNYGERCRPVSLDAYSLDSVSAYNSVRRKGAARASKRSYGNPTFEDSSAIPSHPLNFAGLSTFCNEQNAISEEFAGIPQVTARIDELPQGAEVKNRYANVVPLPETRVSLIKINNDPLTEYINASYVRGPKNATKYYIACQAPIESTVTDFWRMIWEQQSKVVIMLTDLVENGVEKCAEYIPPSEVTDCHRLFGDFQVTLKKRETKEKYAISTLHLKNLENNTFREISHIWYLWPANGVQSDAAGLIAVLLEARALQRGGPGPIVVHCSPGTGRTGTLIALDLGIRQYEITRTVDVPRVVYTIRRDRAGAVQTKEQYAFIYKALNLYATKLAGGALDS